MIKQTVYLFLWAALAFHCLTAVAGSDVPSECDEGSSEYNEAACTETCAEEAHANKPYCEDREISTPRYQRKYVSSTQAIAPQAVTRGYYDDDCSSGISLEASLLPCLFGFLLSFLLL